MHPASKRLFIGIPLSNEVIRDLSCVVARFKRAGDELRWSDPESWHITLQFLGNTTAEQYECLLPQLRTVHGAPFEIRFGELGSFDRAGVFFADVLPSPELSALQKRVIAATSHCGFEPEDRPYHPHITLARNKGRSNGIRKLKQRVDCKEKFEPFAAHEFLLYESFLSSTGSRYEVRDRFVLKAGAGRSQ